MKTRTIFLHVWGFLFLVMLIVACRKEKQLPIWLPGEMLFGSVAAKRNGDTWIASGHGKFSSAGPGYFYFQGGTEDESGVSQENIFFQPIPLIPGRYTVRDKERAFDLDGTVDAAFALEEDDVLEAFYLPDDSKDNYVELIEYDSINKKVRGTFEVYFILEQPWSNTDNHLPKRVYFSEGVFDIRLNE